MQASEFSYGIDIGGTKMELVACDATMRVCYRQRITTPRDDFDAFVDALCGLVSKADDALNTRAPLGLGVPGIIDAATGAHLSANVPCLTGRQLLPVLRERLRRPIALGNDCQCFALSEAHRGTAHGFQSILGLIIGTGAGAGYVVDGRLVRGLNGMAGEWGHWPIGADLLAKHELPLYACPCGGKGCLECYVSGTGLRKLYSHYSGGDVASAELLSIRHSEGDEQAKQVLDVHVDLLGAALARIVLAYDPHAIVLGGGLSKLPHLYLELPNATARHLIKGLEVPRILPPAFGDAGGARGAALLARQAVSIPTKES